MTDPSPNDDLDAELAETDDLLSQSLAQLLRSPADLESRTQSRVTSSLMHRSLLGTGSDLLTVGWQTVRFLFGPDADTTNDTTDETTDETGDPDRAGNEEVRRS